MSTELTRRTLLAGGVLVAGGGAWWLLQKPKPLTERELAVLRLAEGVGLPDSGLGARYLELNRGEGDEKELLELLFPGAGQADAESLRAIVAEGIERDLNELETVQLDGWILSRTEGRLLALTSLLESRQSAGSE